MKAVLAHFWSVWLESAQDVLPRRAYLPGGVKRWSQWARANTLPLREADLKTLNRDTPVDLELSPESALVRSVSLPKSARSRAQSIMALKLKEVHPAKGVELAQSFQRVGRDRDEDVYAQVILHKKDVDDLDQLFRDQKIALRTLFVKHGGLKFTFVDRRQETDKPLLIWWGTAAVAICLALGVLGYQNQKSETDLFALRTALVGETAQLMEHLNARAASNDEQAAQQSAAAEIRDVFGRSVERGILLMQVTQTLPQDAWLTEFNLSGTTLRLSGVTSLDVPALIKGLDDQAWSQNVSLERPVVYDRTRQENRFELKINLTEGAEL